MWTHGSSMPRTDAGVGARLRRWWEQLSLPAVDEGPSTKVRGAAGAEAVAEILQDLEHLPVHDWAAPEHGEPTVRPSQSR